MASGDGIACGELEERIGVRDSMHDFTPQL
jgi:hypothetical protein